ncbi:hypothetical protein L0938_01915 [Paracidovorax citrulli]
MTKPVLVRVKVDEALRCRFRGAASRAHVRPSKLLRLLMEEYVAAQGNHPEVCKPVDEYTCEDVARGVLAKNPPQPPIFVYEDDDEQTVARKEGWWCPSLADDPRY